MIPIETGPHSMTEVWGPFYGFRSFEELFSESKTTDPWATAQHAAMLDSLTISPSKMYCYDEKGHASCEDIFEPEQNECGLYEMTSMASLSRKLPAGERASYRIRRFGGMLKPLRLCLESWDGICVCECVSQRLLGFQSEFSLTCGASNLGILSSNIMGSKYRFEASEEVALPLLIVEFENRLSMSKDDLGPCRRFNATVFPKTSDYVPPPTLCLQQKPVSTSCESFDIFSDSILTSLRLSSLEPTKTLNGYCLDFESTFNVVPSVKNFVLVTPVGQRVISLCKIDKDEYELSIMGGFICALYGFAIACASIDTKLCTQ